MKNTLLELDPWKLPSVPLMKRAKLPDTHGIYFVLHKRKVLYIGKTDSSFRARWKQHHRWYELRSYVGSTISYLDRTEKGKDLAAIENVLIDRFKPCLHRKAGRFVEINSDQEFSGTLPVMTLSEFISFTENELGIGFEEYLTIFGTPNNVLLRG